MKKGDSEKGNGGDSPSQLIDERIAELGDCIDPRGRGPEHLFGRLTR